MLALDAVSKGWFTAEASLLYRKWPGRVTGQAAHVDKVEHQARMSVVQARARVLGELDGWEFAAG